MSYRIEYNPEKNQIYPISAKRKTKWLMIALAAIVALFVIQKVDKTKEIKSLLIPGDPEVTAAAFSTMLENIREGEGVGDAVTAFCLEIISNG